MKTNNKLITKGVLSAVFGLGVCSAVLAQSLETFIQLGLEQSPELEKLELQYQIASEKVNEVNTIPNTELGFGYFVSSPETRTGPQRFKASVKQMMPWFGSVTAREHYAGAMADAQYEALAIAKRKLLATISQLYYSMWSIKEKQDVLETQLILLKTYETLALTAVEVGKASVVDVLKIQMRQNDIVQLKAVLEQEYLAQQSELNLTLNRTKSEKILITERLELPAEDELINTEVSGLHPELLQYDKLYESVEQSELLNQKERAPMIGFGLDYIAVDERTDMEVPDNGKDIFMPMVSLSIPVFNKGFGSKTRQNELRKQELTSGKQQKQNALETVLEKAVTARAKARITYNTQRKNLAQAKDAQDILMAGYETGQVDFNDVLDIEELQLKFELNKIDAILQYYQQQTIIKYLSK